VPPRFDPAAASRDPVTAGVFAHELVHVLQREVGRNSLVDHQTTLYIEMEAYIIGNTIQYDLAALGSSAQTTAKDNLTALTGSLSKAYEWVDSQSRVYHPFGEGTHGSGNWRDTLLELGFSDVTIKHIGSIITTP
jgi:hypothetical protein